MEIRTSQAVFNATFLALPPNHRRFTDGPEIGLALGDDAVIVDQMVGSDAIAETVVQIAQLIPEMDDETKKRWREELLTWCWRRSDDDLLKKSFGAGRGINMEVIYKRIATRISQWRVFGSEPSWGNLSTGYNEIDRVLMGFGSPADFYDKSS